MLLPVSFFKARTISCCVISRPRPRSVPSTSLRYRSLTPSVIAICNNYITIRNSVKPLANVTWRRAVFSLRAPPRGRPHLYGSFTGAEHDSPHGLGRLDHLQLELDRRGGDIRAYLAALLRRAAESTGCGRRRRFQGNVVLALPEIVEGKPAVGIGGGVSPGRLQAEPPTLAANCTGAGDDPPNRSQPPDLQCDRGVPPRVNLNHRFERRARIVVRRKFAHGQRDAVDSHQDIGQHKHAGFAAENGAGSVQNDGDIRRWERSAGSQASDSSPHLPPQACLVVRVTINAPRRNRPAPCKMLEKAEIDATLVEAGEHELRRDALARLEKCVLRIQLRGQPIPERLDL